MATRKISLNTSRTILSICTRSHSVSEIAHHSLPSFRKPIEFSSLVERLVYWSLAKSATPCSESEWAHRFVMTIVSFGSTDDKGLQTMVIPIHPDHGQDYGWRFRVIPIPRRVDREVPDSARVCPIVRSCIIGSKIAF